MNDELETGWQDSLPDDLKGSETLKDITTVSGMAKMLVHSQGMVGKDKIVIPGEDSTEEDRNSFYHKLGRPENADGYELTTPDGLAYDDADLADFRTTAHKAGLSMAQVKALFEWHGGQSVTKAETASLKQKEGIQNAETTLRKDWGSAYDTKKELALKAVRTFMDDDALVAMEEGLGNDPRMVKLFNKVGEAISEDKLKGDVPVYTPVENQDSINKIMGNLQHPYHDKNHPGHEAAVAQVSKFYQGIYPEE